MTPINRQTKDKIMATAPQAPKPAPAAPNPAPAPVKTSAPKPPVFRDYASI